MFLLDFQPKTASAIQWKGDNFEEVKRFIGLEDINKHKIIDGTECLDFYAGEGYENIHAYIGDYIVKIGTHYFKFKENEIKDLFTDHYKTYKEIEFINEPEDSMLLRPSPEERAEWEKFLSIFDKANEEGIDIDSPEFETYLDKMMND